MERTLKSIKKIIREKKKELKERENKTNIFTLDCEICGAKKVKLDGHDFETWDKELFSKQHKHKLRRVVNKIWKF